VSLALRLHEPKSHDDGASDSSDDNILDDLEKEIEDDFDMGALREQRMEELKREMTRVKNMREQDHGRVSEITDEKEVIKATGRRIVALSTSTTGTSEDAKLWTNT